MLVVLIVVAAAIVVGAIAVALGRGGEMAQFTADFAPVDLGAIDEVTATDVALLRLPRALWGYHPQVTDQALGLIAQAISARDVEIAMLQRRLAEVHPAEGAGRQEQFPRPQRPLPPPVADVTGAAAAGPPLPSRPSVRRREMTDQPAMEQPSAGSWPLQAPRSAWQTRSAAASGAPEAGAPEAAPQTPACRMQAPPRTPARRQLLHHRTTRLRLRVRTRALLRPRVRTLALLRPPILPARHRAPTLPSRLRPPILPARRRAPILPARRRVQLRRRTPILPSRGRAGD